MNNPMTKSETVSEFVLRKESAALQEVLDNGGGALPIETISLLSDSEDEDDFFAKKIVFAGQHLPTASKEQLALNADEDDSDSEDDSEDEFDITPVLSPTLSKVQLLAIIKKRDEEIAELNKHRRANRKRRREQDEAHAAETKSLRMTAVANNAVLEDRLKHNREHATWQISNLNVLHGKELFAAEMDKLAFAKERAEVIAERDALLATHRASLARLRSDVRAKDAMIATLNTDHNDLVARLNTLQTLQDNMAETNARNLATIRGLHDTIEDRDETIAELNGAQDDDSEDSDYNPSE